MGGNQWTSASVVLQPTTTMASMHRSSLIATKRLSLSHALIPLQRDCHVASEQAPRNDKERTSFLLAMTVGHLVRSSAPG